MMHGKIYFLQHSFIFAYFYYIFIIGLLSAHLQISHYKNKALDHSIHIYLVAYSYMLLLCSGSRFVRILSIS